MKNVIRMAGVIALLSLSVSKAQALEKCPNGITKYYLNRTTTTLTGGVNIQDVSMTDGGHLQTISAGQTLNFTSTAVYISSGSTAGRQVIGGFATSLSTQDPKEVALINTTKGTVGACPTFHRVNVILYRSNGQLRAVLQYY